MRMRLLDRWILALVCAVSGCPGPTSRTEVLVVVDADTDVRTYARGLVIEVQGAASASPTVLTASANVDLADDRLVWPISLGVVPRRNDATRRFDVVVRARDAADGTMGAVIATAHAVGAFVPGETRVLRIVLDGACLGVVCPDAQTCSAGACGSPEVVTTTLPRYSEADSGTPLPSGEISVCRQDGAFVPALSYRVDTDADGFCVGQATRRCLDTVQAAEIVADDCLAGDDCDDASVAVAGALPYRTDSDGDGVCVGDTIAVCDGAIPSGTIPEANCEVEGPGTIVVDCDDADSANEGPGDYKLDGDGDGSCVGEISHVCPGSEPASSKLVADCRVEVDCDDTNPGIFTGLEVRTDADGDGFCVGPPMSICSATTPPSGTRLPGGCNASIDDCNDAATTAANYGQACDAGCGTIQCNGTCSTSGHGGACDAGCGTIRCNGTCSTSGHGGACDNGCGTIQCNGACSTSGHGGSCDAGCGIIQCNGTCSTSGHGGSCDNGCGTIRCNGTCTTSGHGGACDAGCGTVRCDGTCTTSGHGGSCDAGCGTVQCNGSCSTSGHGGSCDAGCGTIQCNGACSSSGHTGSPICGCGAICQEATVSDSVAVGWGYCAPQKTGDTGTVYCPRGRPVYCGVRFEGGFSGSCDDQGDGTCRYYTGSGDVDALWNGSGCYVHVRAFNCEATTVRAEITCEG